MNTEILTKIDTNRYEIPQHAQMEDVIAEIMFKATKPEVETMLVQGISPDSIAQDVETALGFSGITFVDWLGEEADVYQLVYRYAADMLEAAGSFDNQIDSEQSPV